MIQCKFGCGTQIYYKQVLISDGLGLFIPREDDNRIHFCINLSDFAEDYVPEDWMIALDHDATTVFEHVSGLEFKNNRHNFKKFIIELLNKMPDFSGELFFGKRENNPYCFRGTNSDGSTHPFGVLGLFYQMDGKLEDAKKYFELLKETRISPIVNQREIWFTYASQKIKEIDDELEEIEEEKETSKIPHEANYTLEYVEIDNKKLSEEIKQFEKEDFHNFILKKFPGKKLIELLKNTKEFPKKTTLDEKYKKMVNAEKEKGFIEKQGTPLSYLDFGDKITLVYEKIGSRGFMLLFIKDRRNTLEHSDDTPEELKKGRAADEIDLNVITRRKIKIVKRYFERSLGR